MPIEAAEDRGCAETTAGKRHGFPRPGVARGTDESTQRGSRPAEHNAEERCLAPGTEPEKGSLGVAAVGQSDDHAKRSAHPETDERGIPGGHIVSVVDVEVLDGCEGYHDRLGLAFHADRSEEHTSE